MHMMELSFFAVNKKFSLLAYKNIFKLALDSYICGKTQLSMGPLNLVKSPIIKYN